MNIKQIAVVIFSVVLSSCFAGCASSPNLISSGAPPLAAPGATPTLQSTIAADLQAAGRNLDKAIEIGVLPANDPAAQCVHAVLKQAGLEVTPGAPAPQSFVPENDGIASAGSIAYILAVQARGTAGAFAVPADCQSLIGKLVIDGAADARKLIPGLRLLR